MNILGVKIDQPTMSEAIEQVSTWLKEGGKHYIVTPNVEFVMAAQKDKEFKEVINNADLAIPDSARLGWANWELSQKNPLLKILGWPFFLLPKVVSGNFEVVPGTDLMDKLIMLSAENNYSIGLLGGLGNVAKKLANQLISKYPNLTITYADGGGNVNYAGEVVGETKITIPKTDLLFVAFGHIKQEKWMAENLKTQPVKVMMGVGGAFDYLSGEVKRAPESWRKLGFEWLYRLMSQPWRTKRFGSLVQFVTIVFLS